MGSGGMLAAGAPFAAPEYSSMMCSPPPKNAARGALPGMGRSRGASPGRCDGSEPCDATVDGAGGGQEAPQSNQGACCPAAPALPLSSEWWPALVTSGAGVSTRAPVG